jgi:hypothetical protein
LWAARRLWEHSQRQGQLELWDKSIFTAGDYLIPKISILRDCGAYFSSLPKFSFVPQSLKVAPWGCERVSPRSPLHHDPFGITNPHTPETLSIYNIQTINMDTDAVILQMILQQRQSAARFRTTINAMLEITPILLDDNEEEIEFPSHGGSHPGKQPNRPCDFEGSYNKLMQHYFSAQPLYNEEIFRHRFRMGKPLFMKIAEAIQDFEEYFTL